MITGDSIPKLISLQTSAGVVQSYADKTAFQAAGWDLTWRDVDGTALTTQPTWTIATEGNGAHRVKYTVPSGFWWVEPTVPAGYRMDPYIWPGEGQAYDEDSIAGLLQTAQGIPVVNSAADGDLGDIVNGDSWMPPVITVPIGKISGFGYSTLAGMTISAAFKNAPADTAVACTAAIVDATARTVRVSFLAFPAGLSPGTELTKQFYLDIQLKHTVSGTIITVGRYAVRVVWQRDVTT